MLDLYDRERLENWVSDFVGSDAMRAHPGLAPYATEILQEFALAACDAGGCFLDEVEEAHVRSGLIDGVGALTIAPGQVSQVPRLCGDFLGWLQDEGRLSGGRVLGAYVRALAETFTERATGKQRPFTLPGEKIGRNDPCPCGSGKKYKKCCGKA